jgi:signal transduction histidine kinase
VKRRLLITYLTITALALLVVVVPLGLTFASRERDRLLFGLERDAQVVGAHAEDALEAGQAPDLTETFRNFRVAGGRILVVDRTGISVADSDPSATTGRDFSTRPEIAAALRGERVTGRRSSTTLGTTLVYVAVPVSSQGKVHGAVRITIPTSEADARVRDTWISLGLLSVVVLTTVGLVGLLLASEVTRPVRRLEDAALRLESGDLSARAGEIGGAPEVVALGRQFDATAERLATLVDAQRRFVADASHQLRTPLTALRLRLETLTPDGDDQPRVAAALAETDRLARLVEGLLVLARAEAAGPDIIDVDLVAATHERHQVWVEVARQAGVDLTVTAPGTARVRAVAGGVEQILDNLVSNAIDASPSGSTVRIEVTTTPAEGVLRVVDQGRGMTAEERAQARSRFWRSPGSTSAGFGLGLAIVDHLASASSGSLALDDGPGGRGLAATVRLPAVRPGS